MNGQEVTIGEEPERGMSCTFSMRTNEGVVFVNQQLSVQGRIQQTDLCMGIEKTAAAIEPEIGGRN